MQTIELSAGGDDVFTFATTETAEFSFPLSSTDRQVDVVYFDRPGEVHVNLALGRLCTIGCRECSATMLGRGVPHAMRGNLSAAAVRFKVCGLLRHLAPRIKQQKLVISTMNDGDPLTRTSEDLIAVVHAIMEACEMSGVSLDRLNLSSSLVPIKGQIIADLADRYQEVFGSQVIQLQASLLATSIKRNIFAGDGSLLTRMVESLGYYRDHMRQATGCGETWINYVAVKRGDFGRADTAEQRVGITRVAEALIRANTGVALKITRGTVDDLDGWEQLDEHEYAAFVDAVEQQWGAELAIYCPDRTSVPPESYRCGRIQTRVSVAEVASLNLV